MADVSGVLADLRDESDELDALVAALPPDGWRRPTPAVGWTIAHQIAHLSWTDAVALTAATDADEFAAILERAAAAPDSYVDDAAAELVDQDPALLVRRWRVRRAQLHDALLTVPPDVKLPWFGPPMSATSLATARLMETWAHGQDVADTLGVQRPPTTRLRNIAHLGVRTRDFAYAIRGLTPPAEPFRVELTGPSGEMWAWGPHDATQHVAGAALDFCLLVTQRRHRSELRVTALGADADAWLDIAQAFAGAPGPGREPAS
ncbi:TIGR03084 family protein [Jatrophihabitans endophyticus]|uniref:TIGR03084 family protein n=1 Tax=Jatrophihabitans endophyticus TaxID=1206085 RepID=A0A1M5R6R0_9ACTN|nr:TIGR03084 family metal-binding protein [Jatrophihabitans endophyticus]SHH21730.1 TIGR03084 family protein [Jatrophihabitans endophyticus]